MGPFRHGEDRIPGQRSTNQHGVHSSKLRGIERQTYRSKRSCPSCCSLMVWLLDSENMSHACLRSNDRQVGCDATSLYSATSIVFVLRCYVLLSVASGPVPDVASLFVTRNVPIPYADASVKPAGNKPSCCLEFRSKPIGIRLPLSNQLPESR